MVLKLHQEVIHGLIHIALHFFAFHSVHGTDKFQPAHKQNIGYDTIEEQTA